MTELLKQVLASQYEAALCMVHQCVQACLPRHWEGKIANDTFRQVAYHTLFFADLYLSPSEAEFALRDLHQEGGDERGPSLSPGLDRETTLEYANLCRQKMIAVIAAETDASLKGPSGFSWRRTSRAELHVYNIRHIQHHAGQMSAYLRRVDEALSEAKALPWVGNGWRD